MIQDGVLNLIITGIPSIHKLENRDITVRAYKVLNLIITGIPSILIDKDGAVIKDYVLNLIITGIPSILILDITCEVGLFSFKPYYNWNTFNTAKGLSDRKGIEKVLNLIITGIPSIHIYHLLHNNLIYVLNLIITGIPSIPLDLNKNIDFMVDWFTF